MYLSSSSLFSLSMLDRNSSFTSSPMPSSDSFSFRSVSSSSRTPLISILLGQYSSGALSWLLMSCTIGWFLFLFEVVRLGKQLEPLLRPIDWFTELFVLVLLGQLLNVLCQNSGSKDSLLKEKPSVCAPKEVLNFSFFSSLKSAGLARPASRFSLLGKLRKSLGVSLGGYFTFYEDLLMAALEPVRFSFAYSLIFAYSLLSSKLKEGRESLAYLFRDWLRNFQSALALTASNLTRRESRLLAVARQWWSKRSQSLRQVTMLRVMAASPSAVVGRQILTLFSRMSGLIHTRISFLLFKNTMFSFIMKYPYSGASLAQATITRRAYPKAFSPELSSLRRGRASLLRSSVHTSCSPMASCLPTMILGVPSMWFYSR